MLLTLWELFKLRPPSRKKQKAFWIAGIRDLMDATGEYGTKLLAEVNTEWRGKFENGVAPYTIAGPESLVKVTRAKAAEKRGNYDKYTQGEYAEFVEH